MKTVKDVMKDIRNGETFINGFLEIKLYNKENDTFLVTSLYGGVTNREEKTASYVRSLVKDVLDVNR